MKCIIHFTFPSRSEDINILLVDNTIATDKCIFFQRPILISILMNSKRYNSIYLYEYFYLKGIRFKHQITILNLK